MQELLDLEKIYVWAENSQYFTNKRAVSELKTSHKFQENQRNKIAKRWENNDLPDTAVHTGAIPEAIPPQDMRSLRSL
jgi:hypothetical protein